MNIKSVLRNELLLIDLVCVALMSDITYRCRTHRLSTAVRVVYNLSVNFLSSVPLEGKVIVALFRSQNRSPVVLSACVVYSI